MQTSPLLRTVISLATAAALISCGSPAAPGAGPATFALTNVSGQPLPAAISNTAGGRLIEAVAGALTFQTLLGSGDVEGYLDVRVTDPGAVPRTEREQMAGRAVRVGGAVEVTYATGRRETFAVDGDAAVLNTTAASCAPGTPCLDILRVYRYERVAAPVTP